MGLITGTIYCDTSYANGECQTGYIIEWDKWRISGFSPVFQAANNNDAEIKGIEIACKEAVDFILENESHNAPRFQFQVYNDSIVATTVSDHRYTPSKKASGKFKSTKAIQSWCMEFNVQLNCFRMKRKNPMIKRCDVLSKSYRKNKEKKHGGQICEQV